MASTRPRRETTMAKALRAYVVSLDGRRFSRDELRRHVDTTYPEWWAPGTLEQHLTACVVNNPRAYINHRSTHKFMFRHADDWLELYDEKKHGPNVWKPSQWDEAVSSSMKLSPERRNQLAAASPVPKRYEVTTVAYDRNPHVAAAVLLRAQGHCEACMVQAPFVSRFTDRPYLEVHHRTRLADGGHDTVENAIALCPNCHRRAHFGPLDDLQADR